MEISWLYIISKDPDDYFMSRLCLWQINKANVFHHSYSVVNWATSYCFFQNVEGQRKMQMCFHHRSNILHKVWRTHCSSGKIDYRLYTRLGEVIFTAFRGLMRLRPKALTVDSIIQGASKISWARCIVSARQACKREDLSSILRPSIALVGSGRWTCRRRHRGPCLVFFSILFVRWYRVKSQMTR